WLFTERPAFSGFEDTWTPVDCEGRACVEPALASVHADVKVDLWGSQDGVRPMGEVLEDGYGSGWEKSLLLGDRLKRSGLTVHYGLANRDGRRRYDKEIPNMNWLDHLIVIVPEQQDIETDLFIDPTCEYCTPDEIPNWLTHTQVLRLRHHKDKFKVKVVELDDSNAVAPGLNQH